MYAHYIATVLELCQRRGLVPTASAAVLLLGCFCNVAIMLLRLVGATAPSAATALPISSPRFHSGP